MDLKPASLDHGHIFNEEYQVLESSSNGGLFSNFFHCMWSLIDLHNQGCAAKQITFRNGNRMFRVDDTEDLYQELFVTNAHSLEHWLEVRKTLDTIPRPDHHGAYALYPFAIYKLLMSAYFQPSSQVLKVVSEMQEKYSLSDARFSSLYFRGTDKGTEVQLPKIDLMIDSLLASMEENDIEQCLVQTDDSRVLERALKRLPDSIILDELPTTSSDAGFHYMNADAAVISPLLLSIRLCAMTEILAKSTSLVLPTSNLAAWICLLRGNTSNVIQFNKHGSIADTKYIQLFRIKNMLRAARAKILGRARYV